MAAAPSHSLLHGTSGFFLAYALVLGAMLAALIRRRAPLRTRWQSPFWSLLVLFLAAIIVSAVAALLPLPPPLQSVVGLLLTTGIAYAAGIFLARLRPNRDIMRFRRGAVVTSARPATIPSSSSGVSAPTSRTSLTLAGVPVPLADETKHFKLIGTTGTGKSTAIRELLGGALRRGDRAIIADPDGGYLARFYDPARGDVILNPFDPDACRWDLFSEISQDYDVEQLARSLIPDQGTDPVWPGYARTFFSAVVHQLIKNDERNDRELYRVLTKAPQPELRSLLAGTVAGPFLEIGNEKMFGSIRSVTTSALSALDYTTQQKATPFSVRQWIRQSRVATTAAPPRGVLFLPYKAGEIAALRSVISAWLRLAIFEAMDGDELDQRLWFVVDELDALGQIDGLKDALARLRKFGGRCILGFQSIAQVSATYGKGNAETIVENCGNSLILRCSASEHGGTAEFASRLIGQREIIYTQRSRTRNPGKFLSSVTSSEQLRAEPAVLASQIERLPDLTGYLKLASYPDWHAVAVTPTDEPMQPRTRRAAESVPVAPAAADPAASPPVPAAVAVAPTAGPPTRKKTSRRPAAAPRVNVTK
ncbi:MAG TPA: type IV secretion system DNA-binding domain-containing protein [Steroidobacteraceae bacterium]|jgi:type IV secretory pathway TraG/TraD family ATPase VirD4|nr:type IV secretion system DNA-binding domain-containing protein [Steroidobacteraceae bacterium]